MPDVSFDSLTVVLGIAFVAPLVLGCVPRLRIPAVVVEIVLGIVVGPQVLDWARVDDPVAILSVIGLAFLLFLCGLEVDLDQLRGRILSLAALSFGISLALALLAGVALDAAGFVRSPLLAGIILTATSLGLVLPVLKESGRADDAVRSARVRRRHARQPRVRARSCRCCSRATPPTSARRWCWSGASW